MHVVCEIDWLDKCFITFYNGCRAIWMALGGETDF
jgi:hypothetical protein